ncbi:MAG: (2Fe-2S)-binding protein [Bacteroidetes bacterium]|nr:(2Fe-2S)-binding protein [Bacteroidota bacterium]
MTDITINVQLPDGSIITHIAPTDMGLSLMEFLKGNEYNIPATCGGMALCATCHVEVIEGFETLSEISNDENAMLDTLPNITPTSRLSCQLKLNHLMDNLTVKIIGDGL